MGGVIVRVLHVDDPPLEVSYWIEACISVATSFSPRIFQDASLLDFRWSVTTIFNLLPLLCLFIGRLLPFILLRRGRKGARWLWWGVSRDSLVLGVESIVWAGGTVVAIAGLVVLPLMTPCYYLQNLGCLQNSPMFTTETRKNIVRMWSQKLEELKLTCGRMGSCVKGGVWTVGVPWQACPTVVEPVLRFKAVTNSLKLLWF